MEEIRSKAPSEFRQPPLLGSDHSSVTSLHFQIDTSASPNRNGLVDDKIQVPSAKISGGNLPENPTRIGLEDLRDDELEDIDSRLSGQDRRNLEDQGILPRNLVKITRDTKSGTLTGEFSYKSLVDERERREQNRLEREKLGQSNGHPPKKTARQIMKEEEKKRYAEYMRDKNRHLTPRIRSDR